MIQVGSSEFLWLWAATTEPKNRLILALHISKERNTLHRALSVDTG